MIVAASTECLPDLPLVQAFEKLPDLEFTNVEVDLHEHGPHVKPSEVLDNLEQCIALIRDTHRLNLTAYSVMIDAPGDVHYEQFAACCRLAKATKVACITVPSAELGTPFNEEVEHLRRLVRLADEESVRVSIRSQIGRLSEDPDTVVVLCDNVRGLGVALDPSHYICGRYASRGFDQLFRYTHNVYLRDTTKDQLQVRVGQGVIDYGRLIIQLRRVHYQRALCVDIMPTDDSDHTAELRKLRLLLESLL